MTLNRSLEVSIQHVTLLENKLLLACFSDIPKYVSNYRRSIKISNFSITFQHNTKNIRKYDSNIYIYAHKKAEVKVYLKAQGKEV